MRADDDIRAFLPLPRTALHVLLALSDGAKHGWAIREHAESVSAGTVRPGPGTLYEAIARLEERGLIEESSAVPAGASDHSQRRYYGLTRLGSQVLESEIGRLARVVEHAWAHGVGRPGGVSKDGT